MSILGFIYVVLLAILIALFFNYGLHIRGPWGTLWTFFLVIFLAVWIAHLWIRPLGPHWRDVYWLPPLGTGLLVALLLAAATSPRSRIRRNRRFLRREDRTTRISLGIFFWITLIVLIIIILVALFLPGYYTYFTK